MKTTIATFLFLSLPLCVCGQGNPLGSFTNLALYQGKKKAPELNYSDIKGHYLFNEKFQAAKAILKDGRNISITSAKLNLFFNEVNYIENQMELNAPADQFQQLILLGDTNTGDDDNVFEIQKLDGVDEFFQVMNSGNIRLLKRKHIELRRGEYDPMLGKHDFRFVENDQFFIEEGSLFVRIYKFNKKAIASLIKLTPQMEEWLALTKNNLETESELITFLNHCNNLRSRA